MSGRLAKNLRKMFSANGSCVRMLSEESLEGEAVNCQLTLSGISTNFQKRSLITSNRRRPSETPPNMSIQRQIAENLLRELSDRGKIVEGGWKAYELLSGLQNCPEVQRNECRKAFFLGAQHLWSSMFGCLDPGMEPTDRDMDRMEKLQAELEKFTASLKGKL